MSDLTPKQEVFCREHHINPEAFWPKIDKSLGANGWWKHVV